MIPFDQLAYGAWRQTVDNSRALASAERFVLPPPPHYTVLDALERASWVQQQQTQNEFNFPQPEREETLGLSPTTNIWGQEETLGLPGIGKFWDVAKRVVKVSFKYAGYVGDAMLIYNFLKGAYELRDWIPFSPAGARPPVVYNQDTSMNYYLQNDGTYKPGGIKMQ